MDSNLKIRLKLSDSSKKLLDKAKEDGDISKLTVKIEATHSGIINANHWFYTPAGMADGASTFTSPYPKPVLLAHDSYADAVGRVLESEYVPYDSSAESGIGDTIDTKSILKQIKEFTKSEIFTSAGYKGLGHIMLTVEITDSDAIERLLDERYLSVSISGDTEQVVCSICGVDKKSPVKNEDYCDHWRGDVYEDETAYLIAGGMTFKEVSFVNIPADENAKVDSIKDNFDLADSIEAKELEIIDFVTRKKGDNTLKIKIKDLTSNGKLQADLDQTLKTLGLSGGVQDKETLDKLRKTSFLFADSRMVPLNTGHALVAAYQVLENVEEGDDKAALLTVMDTKWKREFGAKTMGEAIANLKAKIADGDSSNTEGNVSLAEIDYKKITDSIVQGLKGSFALDDTFLGARNRQLEEDLFIIAEENKTLSDSIRVITVNQIMDAEDRAADEGYRKELEGRTIESLTDKLSDIAPKRKKKKIKNPNVNIDDDATHGEDDNDGDEGDADETDLSDGKALTAAEVRSEYRRLIKDEGLSKASLYIKDLRTENKLPKNFSF